MRINSSTHADANPRQGLTSDRAAEHRDHARSLERSARDRNVRELDRHDRISFGDYLRRENLGTPVAGGSLDETAILDHDKPTAGRFGAPRIGDVFKDDSSEGQQTRGTDCYSDRGVALPREAMSGFTARLIDVIA